MEDMKRFPGKRNTYLFQQTPGVRNAIYPWVIMQDANGSTVKLAEDQLKGIIKVVLESWGYNVPWTE